MRNWDGSAAAAVVGEIIAIVTPATNRSRMAAWGIAFVEYCLAVPANRWGSAIYTTAQLKTIQEVITLLVFAGFSVLYLREPLTWNYAIGFVLIAAGAYFVFRGPL
jgi:uncharacterized protein